MKKVTTIILLLVVIIAGCNGINSNEQMITEAEAKQIIIDERSRDGCNAVEILEVTSEPDKYIIKWETAPVESGLDSINKRTGKLKMIKSSRGTCKWK